MLRDLGVVREVGWLLDQFDVRRSTMHPYSQVLPLVKDVMSSAPSSATGQPYSATGQQKAPSGASALRSHPSGTNAGGSGSAKNRSVNALVSPRADLQFAGEGIAFADVMDVL